MRRQHTLRLQRIILWTLTLTWMAVIYLLSAETMDESAQTSGQLIARLLHVFWQGFDTLDSASRASLVEQCKLVVRTLAHFSEYALLGLLLRLLTSRYPLRHPQVVSFCAAAVYAALDELHQLFVPERVCDMQDWCVDSSGALLGVVCAALLLKLFRAYRLRRQAKNT